MDRAINQSSGQGSEGSKENTLEKIQSTEKIRNNARMVKQALVGMATRQGLNHVTGPHPEDNTHHMESHTKTELEQLCLAEAGQCFTQVATTPFLQSPLLELFTGANISTKVFDQVLNRMFECPPEMDKMAQHLLTALKRPENITQIKSRNLDKITTGWHKAREATSSAPSAVHFRHYMAGTFNPTIAIFNARLANLGFTTGYSLKRWRTGLNVMLEKIVGNFNVEKLRIILLFEGDFNNNNKWLGRAVMFNAEEHQQMAPEQYGSWKEKLADIQCLNKCLLYDHACYMHEPLAICSNNAKSCYNQIVLIVAALCLCRLGAPNQQYRVWF